MEKAFEEEMDALSSHSSDPEGPEDPGDPIGKNPEEIAVRGIRAQAKDDQGRAPTCGN